MAQARLTLNPVNEHRVKFQFAALAYDFVTWAREQLEEVARRAELGGWNLIDGPEEGSFQWRFRDKSALHVIASAMREADGHRWLHVAVFRNKRKPTVADMENVKEIFVGRDRTAILILPRFDEQLDDPEQEFALHLWHCFDGEPVPDFRKLHPNGHVTL